MCLLSLLQVTFCFLYKFTLYLLSQRYLVNNRTKSRGRGRRQNSSFPISSPDFFQPSSVAKGLHSISLSHSRSRKRFLPVVRQELAGAPPPPPLLPLLKQCARVCSKEERKALSQVSLWIQKKKKFELSAAKNAPNRQGGKHCQMQGKYRETRAL